MERIPVSGWQVSKDKCQWEDITPEEVVFLLEENPNPLEAIKAMVENGEIRFGCDGDGWVVAIRFQASEMEPTSA